MMHLIFAIIFALIFALSFVGGKATWQCDDGVPTVPLAALLAFDVARCFVVAAAEY